jgi:hypothetical protein
MATLLLSSAGAALGGTIGGSLFGISAATIGGALGAVAGSVVDSLIIGALAPDQRIQGPRLDDLRVTSATEGAVIPRLYGTMRLGGNIIWATDFREEQVRTSESSGGKGSPTIVTEGYRYFASFAVALCEGPIGGVCRIWADGKPFAVPGAVWRVHKGTEDQLPDPFIDTLEGPGQTPAYRGVAYVVFEDLPLDAFGNRLPQLSFEVIRPSPDPGSMEQMVHAVNLIPAAGEFIYATETVTRTGAAPGAWKTGDGAEGASSGDGTAIPENENSVEGLPDLVASLNRLEAALPKVEAVSLVVAWFGTDLRAGQCQIKPGVESRTKVTAPLVWTVDGVTRADAHLISTVDGGPAYGGTPSDATIVQAIRELKARGKRVTFYPFILMDVPAGNTLPDPYAADGALGQPAYPWRGRITCTPAAGVPGTADKTAAAAAQVAAFFGTATAADFEVAGEAVSFTGAPDDWGLRRMILHYAHLCAAAGGVDAFLIGSELRGLTQIRSGAATYPAVAELVALAAAVRGILGPATKISYAADWSEYFGHQPTDGSGDVFFHLDPLWASPDVNFIAIDNYLPLSDWRDGDAHLDAQAGWVGPYDMDYLQANIAGGEGHDWFYASAADRAAQVRTPVSDGFGKPWVFRTKDLANWWGQPHVNRPGGVESGSPTAWVPGSKPIRFTEAGAPCVDRGMNQPNVFVDPKSSESFLPYFSRGWPDEFVQRRYAEALIGYWTNQAHNPAATHYSGRMLETDEIALWTWDARPFPTFPARSDVWSDAENWRLGHWLTGRAGATGLAELVAELCARAGMTADDVDVSDLVGSVPGFAITAIESPRASIEALARLFGFDAVETGGRIVFRMRGHRPVATITAEGLVAPNRNAEDLELTRAQETELPLALKWRMMARDEEFAGITVEARRITVDTSRIAAEQLPIAATSGAAERGVRRALFEAWTGRETAAFTLPPSRLALDPTDVILLDHDDRLMEFTLTSITDGAGRKVAARRSDRALYDLAPGANRAAAAPAVTVPASPLVALMNLPKLSEDVPDWQPYAAAYSSPWPGTTAVWWSAGEDGFAQLTTLSRPGWFGTLAFDLYAGPVNRFDLGNEIWIDMLAGSFASVSDAGLLSGKNSLAIETAPDLWEIVGFGTASPQAPRRWKLTRLLRGLLGTEDAIANPAPAGSRVVMLDAGVKAVPIGSADHGAPWNWRIGAAGKPVGDPALRAATFTPTARGMRPWRPCHARRVDLPGGDIVLSWTRRTRAFAGDNWTLNEVPLGETAEAYALDILNGGAVVRTVTSLTAPAFNYTGAMQAADFGGAVTGPLRIYVAQIGALGAGPALDVTL